MNKHKLAWFWMTEAVIRMMTIVGVFFYAVVALIHDLLLIPQGPERMSRLVMLALQVAGILIFNSSRGLSVRAKSSLVPISAAVLELIPFFVTGGDRFYVFAALGFSILSFIYMSPLGLLIYMGFVNALLIPLIFIFRINVLGPGISRSREITEFLIFNVCSLMLYSISVLIWREVSDIDKTRKTFETVLETTPNYMVVTDENAETKYISKSLADWLGLADKRYAQDRPLLDLFRSGKITGIFQEILEQGGRVAREFNITQDG
ncbi:MAG: hypothetical protein LBQ44_10455, partial [Treponema sp.]|nr:hypothetical protein [Treponema sp.]